MYWLGSVVVVHARRCDAVCKMWRVLRIGLMSFATRPGQPWCRGLVAVHWTSLRRRRGWSYEVLMLSRYTVWSVVAGRYLDTWSFIHRTLHNRSPHLSIHSKYRLSQHQK